MTNHRTLKTWSSVLAALLFAAGPNALGAAGVACAPGSVDAAPAPVLAPTLAPTLGACPLDARLPALASALENAASLDEVRALLACAGATLACAAMSTPGPATSALAIAQAPVDPARPLVAPLDPIAVGCNPGDAVCSLTFHDNVGPACGPEDDATYSGHGTIEILFVETGAATEFQYAAWYCADSPTYYSPSGPTIRIAYLGVVRATVEDEVFTAHQSANWFWVAVPAWDYEYCAIETFALGTDAPDAYEIRDCPLGPDGNVLPPPLHPAI